MRRFVAGALAVAACSSASSAAAATLSFVSRVPVAPGASFQVVAADFNGDGRPDIAGVDPAANSVYVSLRGGTGADGLYAPPSRVPVGSIPYGLATGDFNGDGKADLATVNNGDNTVSVRLGNGDGTFANTGTVSDPGVNTSIASADLNGDGKDDLVTANPANKTVGVLRSNGDGTFSTSTLSVAALELAVGDIDGDGKRDVVVLGTDQRTLTVLLGQGDGTFARSSLTGPAGSKHLGVGDIDGNGRDDIAVVVDDGSNATAGQVTIIARTSSGAYTQTAPIATQTRFPRAIAVGDLDGDGDADLALADSSFNDRVKILMGRADGTVTRATDVQVHGSSESWVVMSDFDRDGKLDLVTANADATFGLLRNAGDGTFSSPTIPVGFGIPALAVADFNADGAKDVAAAGNYDDSVHIRLGRGDGTFTAAPTITTGRGPIAVTTADFNHDGKPDLATADATANQLSVLLGRGDGTFARFTTAASGPQSIAHGDFNGDGNEDLATGNPDYSTVGIMLGQGDGTFTRGRSVSLGGRPLSLVARDLSGDGVMDLAVTDTQAGTVRALLGNGDGTFAVGATLTVGSVPFSVVAGDFDGDGIPDLATANHGGGTVSVLWGTGGGAFAATATTFAYGVVGAPFSLTAGDIDGNGADDLIATSYNSTGSQVLSFGASRVAANTPMTTYAGAAAALADFDGDGRLDLVDASLSDTIGLLLNRTAIPNRTLTIARSGVGTGSVSSSPAGIACGATCSHDVLGGTDVTLTAVADSSSIFTGFRGEGCTGTGTCTVNLGKARTVTATFALRRTLTVTKAGSGSGTTTSAPSGIACRTTCSADFGSGTSVTFTANPDSNSTFVGFTGGGCATGPSCTLAVDQNATITATYARKRTLTVALSGSGSGSVMSADSAGAISCGAICSAKFAEGQTVTLSADPDPGSVLTGYSGEGCSGTGSCTVTMDRARAVTVTFSPVNGPPSPAVPVVSGPMPQPVVPVAAAPLPPHLPATRTFTASTSSFGAVSMRLDPGAAPTTVTVSGTLRVGHRAAGHIRSRRLYLSQPASRLIPLDQALRRAIRHAHARHQTIELVLRATFGSGAARLVTVKL